jgi:hypothetical protein
VNRVGVDGIGWATASLVTVRWVAAERASEKHGARIKKSRGVASAGFSETAAVFREVNGGKLGALASAISQWRCAPLRRSRSWGSPCVEFPATRADPPVSVSRFCGRGKAS